MLSKDGLKALSLYEIGQNLLLGDIPEDLRDLLTEEEALYLTQLRNELGHTLIAKSGLNDTNCSFDSILLKLRQD